jgi:hypothetical protein
LLTPSLIRLKRSQPGLTNDRRRVATQMHKATVTPAVIKTLLCSALTFRDLPHHELQTTHLAEVGVE